MDDILSRMGSLATNDEPRPFRHTSTHWRAACGEGPGGRSLFGDRGRDDGARSFGGEGAGVASITPCGFTPTLADAPPPRRRESWSSTDDEGCCVPITRRPGDPPAPPSLDLGAFGARRFSDAPLLSDAPSGGLGAQRFAAAQKSQERAYERRRLTRTLPNPRVRRRSPSPDSSECSSPSRSPEGEPHRRLPMPSRRRL